MNLTKLWNLRKFEIMIFWRENSNVHFDPNNFNFRTKASNKSVLGEFLARGKYIKMKYKVW